MFIQSPPTTDTNSEEYRAWLIQLGSAHNQLVTVGSGSSTADSVEGTEVTDDGRILVADNFIGYAHRYIHLRFASDTNGTNLVDPNTFTGSSIFVGVFNSPSTTTPAAGSNYVFQEFTWSAAPRDLYYTNTGGRTLRFTSSTADPGSGAILITDASVVTPIDLDVGAGVGATGATGADAIQTVLSIRDTTGIDLTTDPAGWIVDGDGMFFRNNQGSLRTLVASVIIGGVEQDFAAHNTYTYAWTRNGATFAPTTAGQTLTTRYLQITAEDIEDNGADQFVCTVSNIPD